MRWAALFAVCLCTTLLVAVTVRAQQDSDEQELQALQNSVARSHAQENQDWDSQKTELQLDTTGRPVGQAATAGGMSGRGANAGTTTANVSMCTAQNAPTYHECASNSVSQSACYQAAAWVCNCYLEADPTNPHASNWRQCVAQNNSSAASLRSNAPTIGR